MTKKKEPVPLKRKVSKPPRKVDYNKIRGSSVQPIVIKEEDLSDVDQRNEDLSDVVEKIDGVASEIPAKRRKLAASSRKLKKTETSTTLVVLEAQNQEHVVPKLEGCTDVVVFEGETSSALVVAQVPKLEVSTNIVRSNGATSKGEPSYRSGFHGLSKLCQRFEKDEEKRKEREKMLLEDPLLEDKGYPLLVWFKEEHLEILEGNPFSKVLNLFIHKEVSTDEKDWEKCHHSILSMIKTYRHDVEVDEEDHCFDFVAGNVKVTLKSTPNDLDVFFGIRRPMLGSSLKKCSAAEYAVEKDVMDYFPDHQLKKKLIEQTIILILKDKTEDIAEIKKNGVQLSKLLTLYLCVTVFFTTADGSWIHKDTVKNHVRTISRMHDVDCPLLIHNNLMSSIKKKQIQALGC